MSDCKKKGTEKVEAEKKDISLEALEDVTGGSDNNPFKDIPRAKNHSPNDVKDKI